MNRLVHSIIRDLNRSYKDSEGNRSALYSALKNVITSARLSLWLGLICVTASMQSFAQNNSAAGFLLGEIPMQTVGAGDWTTFNTKTEIADGSTLFRYVAQIRASESDSVGQKSSVGALRFTFVPRFNCTPLVTVLGNIPPSADNEAVESLMEQFRALKVSVDGSIIAFPTIVERNGQAIKSFYDTNLPRRATLRILLEVGSSLSMQIGEEGAVQLSLSGSKQAISTAHARCQNHS